MCALGTGGQTCALPICPGAPAPRLTIEGDARMKPINLAAKLGTFHEPWQPRTVGTFNGHDLMVVKANGAFNWHRHDDTDDFFLVLEGRLVIDMREASVTLGPGEMFVVPKGVEHRPRAEEDTHVLLIEPSGTPNPHDAPPPARRPLASRAGQQRHP